MTREQIQTSIRGYRSYAQFVGDFIERARILKASAHSDSAREYFKRVITGGNGVIRECHNSIAYFEQKLKECD